MNHAKFLEQVRDLKERGGKLLSIAFTSDDNEECRFVYYFDVSGEVKTLQVITENRTLPSVLAYFSSCDFLEREICKEYNVKFVGNPNLPLKEKPVITNGSPGIT